MWVLIGVITIIFFLSAFFGAITPYIANPFVSYLFFQLTFIFHYFIFFFVGFFLVFFLHLSFQRKGEKEYVKTIFQSVAVGIIGLFSAFVALFILAILEVNTFAILLNINPSLLDVTTNTKTILQRIQKQHLPPSIITSDTLSQNAVIAIARANAGATNLYGQTILPAIPTFLIFPVKNLSSSFLLVDNTLIVTRLNEKDLKLLSPTLGFLLVQHYFPTRQIKSFPYVSVMNEQEYLSFRKHDAATKLAKITVEITHIEDSMSSTSAHIQKDNDALADNAQTQTATLKQQEAQYNACLSQGTYTAGVFHPTHTKTYCQQMLNQWEETLEHIGNQESSLSATLQKDQQQLKDFQYYDNFFKAQKTLLTLSNTNIPSELGVFEQPNSIKIVINSSNSQSVMDYFETLSHEYLHYASFVQGRRLESSFFEEGLTEYFARASVKDALQITTNIGYPVAVKIIEEMTKKIAETDLADIYFRKDERGLEKELDLVYGDNFYKNNFVLFESLQYTSDPKQILQIANTILKHMGASPLQEKDLFSSQSSL